MEVLKFSEMRLKKDKVVFQLPIHKIRSNPYQPRKYFNRAALEELADSIRAYGILQPITVRKMSGGAYELVAGERRLRAAELAGLETIPAILMQVSDSDSAVMAFIENIQRQNLSFLEEAEGYRNMMEDYGLTQEELAAKLSKSQSSIANKLRILKLEDSVKKLLLEHHFTERHARALLKLPDEESRLFVLAQMIQEEMNVKKTEELVEATLEQMRPRFPEKGEQKEKRYVRSSDFRLFTNTIKQSVEVIRRSGVDVVYEDKQDADCCEILIRADYGHIALYLREIMEERGITRNQLAKRIDARFEVVNKWYQGELEKMDLDILARICYALDCTTEDLLEYIPAKPC